jgi:Tat protein secretion system quality control protein TatD with DNase activity
MGYVKKNCSINIHKPISATECGFEYPRVDGSKNHRKEYFIVSVVISEEIKRVDCIGYILLTVSVGVITNKMVVSALKSRSLLIYHVNKIVYWRQTLPYISPLPYRGKRNESSYITFIAKKN